MRKVVLVVAGLAAAASSAGADTYSVHAILDGDVAATDNVFSVPSGGVGTTPKQADVYIQVRPGVLFAYDTPRMIQELTAQFEALEYVRNNDSASLTFRGGWQGFFQPTPRTEILTHVTGSTGTANALTSRVTPDQTATVVLPAGNVDIDQVEGGERIAYQLTQDLRVIETALVRYTTTDDNAGDTIDSFETGATIAIERNWRATAIGLEAGATYLRLDRHTLVPELIGFDRDHQIDPHLYGVVRRDFGPHWTANVTGGVVDVIPTLAHRTSELFPVVGAQVGYTDLWGSASLQASRAVAADQFIAENTLSDSVTLTVNLPLPWLRATGREPALFAQAAAGVSRTQLVDSATGSLASSFDLVHADVGVTWLARPGMSFGLRYELISQSGDSAQTLLIPGFTRDTLFFTFAIRLPPRVAAGVPRRTGLRADGRDLAPVGDELVVPEIAAPAADGTSNGGPGPSPP